MSKSQPKARHNTLPWSILTFLFAAATSAWSAIPDNPKDPQPGLEIGTWSVEEWGNPGAAEHLEDGPRKVLKLTFNPGKKEKTAFKHLTGQSVDPQGKIRFHLYTPEEDAPRIAIALSTTDQFVWYESKLHQLTKGWNFIEIELGKEKWKTKDTDWMFKTPVNHLEHLRALTLLVFNKEMTGWMLLEGLTLDLDEKGKRIARQIEALLSTDPKKRAEAETALVDIGEPAVAALKYAQLTDREEVRLRVEWALKKIQEKPATDAAQESPKVEAKEEPGEPNTHKETQEAAPNEEERARYEETVQRMRYVLKRMDFDGRKMQELLRESLEKRAQAQRELASMKQISPDQKKILKQLIEEVETLTKTRRNGFPDLEKAEPTTEDKAPTAAPKADKEAPSEVKTLEKKPEGAKRKAWDAMDELDE